MDLKDILTISGQPGLFKMISQGNNAVIVESLETGKKMPAHARLRISSLEDIAIFTETEDLPLREVFVKMFETFEGKTVEGLKKMSGDELKSLFASILPDYDEDRVYTSDMKKAFQWYNKLVEKEILTAEALKEDEGEKEAEKESDTTEKESDAPEKND